MGKGTPLVFREYEWSDTLIQGDFNVMVPDESKRIAFPQVLIAPLVGFTEECRRIGYGGGFYDRTIRKLR